MNDVKKLKWCKEKDDLKRTFDVMKQAFSQKE